MQPNLGAITYERKAVQTGWIHLAGLACMIIGVACTWIMLGALLRRRTRTALGPMVIRRTGSLVLVGFAGMMLAL